MTDKEIIIKALERCCLVDPKTIFIRDDRTGETTILNMNDVFDLITRQQAEIERLKEQPYTFQIEVSKKIESEIRAKVIKEFAERLKKVWWDNGYESPDVDFDDFVDNLVKEMVGDKE